MFKATKDLTLPTTITGSLPRPSWYTENLAERPFRDAIADARFREQYTDAVATNIRDQERAGLDIVTDGDARFDTDVGGMSWFQYPARRFKGLAGGDYFRTRKGYGGTAKGDIIFEVMESRVMPRCVGQIERGPLQYGSLWKVAQGMTTRPVKFGTITPELIGTSVGNDYYQTQEELIRAFSAAMHDELLELAGAGCSIIQMEEPNIHLVGIQRGGGAQLGVEFFVDVFNDTVKGLRGLTEVWAHTCWGNPAQQRLFATNQSYKDALPHLNKLDVDVLTFECCTTDGMDLEAIGKTITDKKIAIGVVDHRNLQVERPEQVADLIRRALKHIPIERLALSSDCGFGREGMSRRIAFYKMIAIVRGANIVRRELGLPEAACLAADPRYALAEDVMMPERGRTPFRDDPARWLLAAAVCLAGVFVAIKAYFLGVPTDPVRTAGQSYLRALAALSYTDVIFAALVWAVARALLACCGRWLVAQRIVVAAFMAAGALACFYAVANVVMFSSFGGFLTYPLLALVGDVRMLRSSAGAYLTPPVIAALVSVPLFYVAAVWVIAASPLRIRARRYVPIVLLAWMFAGWQAYAIRWTTRQERAVAENPEWVFVSSWWRAVHGSGIVQMPDLAEPGDLADFDAIGRRPMAARIGDPAQSLNVIVIVIESLAARWTGLHNPIYADATPSLIAESAHALVVNNVYAHIGRSSNSLVSILLSRYPKLDFREITDVYPRLPGTSLAGLFKERGYRTSFITPSDLAWAGWTTFLKGRGLDEMLDQHQLGCPLLTSWGAEDRCMFDGIQSIIARDAARPFFILGWTTQTHHPYEPTPGRPILELVREPVGDHYELNRYLNVLRETDEQLGRLFTSLRRAGIDRRTLVVVVGDHGQAFGYPHEGDYTQGRSVYEEDVHVPLMLWHPGRYKAAMRSDAIGGLVDLAPTIADLAGLPPAPDWQGRSLIDGAHPPRVYFYVAEDHFRLGVRQEQWKYVYDLREGAEELYDLEHDADEQHNLAASEPQISARLRQRLAAWTEANHRQYGDR